MSRWHSHNQSSKVEPVAGEKKYRISRLFFKWHIRLSVAMFTLGVVGGMIGAVIVLTE